jgi:hypothetical protein
MKPKEKDLSDRINELGDKATQLFKDLKWGDARWYDRARWGKFGLLWNLFF